MNRHNQNVIMVIRKETNCFKTARYSYGEENIMVSTNSNNYKIIIQIQI